MYFGSYPRGFMFMGGDRDTLKLEQKGNRELFRGWGCRKPTPKKG